MSMHCFHNLCCGTLFLDCPALFSKLCLRACFEIFAFGASLSEVCVQNCVFIDLFQSFVFRALLRSSLLSEWRFGALFSELCYRALFSELCFQRFVFWDWFQAFRFQIFDSRPLSSDLCVQSCVSRASLSELRVQSSHVAWRISPVAFWESGVAWTSTGAVKRPRKTPSRQTLLGFWGANSNNTWNLLEMYIDVCVVWDLGWSVCLGWLCSGSHTGQIALISAPSSHVLKPGCIYIYIYTGLIKRPSRNVLSLGELTRGLGCLD